MLKTVDVIVVGAGAAGLMCAIEAAKRHRSVLVLDSANKPGKKILMSGGGRCNFTNLNIKPERYISHNAHFCKSALSRFTQWDFIDWVKRHRIAFHEKKLGQLFCDDKSKAILEMLLTECEQWGVTIQLNETIQSLEIVDAGFKVQSNQAAYRLESLVIATGGLSIPTLGGSAFGYEVAKQFGIKVWPTRAGLVPFVFSKAEQEEFSSLAGVSNEARVEVDSFHFDENILVTHKGLSGPAILQISNYWEPDKAVSIDLAPGINLVDILRQAKKQQPNTMLKTVLGQYVSKRLVSKLLNAEQEHAFFQSFSDKALENIAKQFHQWIIYPAATEGYSTAEVTLGGVDCNALSSKTLEANGVKGLYFIGEVVDVTGWLGGYNFQWAWSSGWAAGQAV